MRLAPWFLLCLLGGVLPLHAATVSGRVVDTGGTPLPGATVSLEGPARASTTTGADGTFEIDNLSPGSYDVAVSVPGFDAWRTRLSVSADAPTPALAVTLELRVKDPPLVVTASRGAARGSDPAAPVSVVTARDLARAVSSALDDVLRSTPGFSLFRRTSSRTANPTTQGATLRGLAASGASRALVVADGVPLNDPFGGWVYWNRVPQASIDRVEVVRGAVSDLYGADALGGVVQVLSASSTAPAARLVLDGDTAATARASAFGAASRGRWSASAAVEASRTDGSFVIDGETRGAIDRRAGGDYVTARVGGGFDAKGWRGRAYASAFGESRRNGTARQLNDTSSREATGNLAGPVARGFLEASTSIGDQTYHQSFSSIAADRAAETLTSRQTVPTTAVRGAVSYRLPVGPADLLAGYDSRGVEATNGDVAYFPSGAVRGVTKTRGNDFAQGLYVQVRSPLGGRASVTAGIRGDRWFRDESGDSVSVASPRVSASYRLTPHVVLRGSATRGFRAPTINERIRPFRAGNVLTLANEDLAPERVTLGEGGLLVQGARGSVRAAAFTSVVRDAVTNVTVSSTPQLITRQRQNAAEVLARGAEAEGDWRVAATFAVNGTLAYTRSSYRGTVGLSGNDVPQLPRWQGTLCMRWQAPAAWTVQALVRSIGAQFEDDRNTLVLRRATLVDATVDRPVGHRMSLLAALENVFDVDYDTGRTPTRTIGTPLTARVALRLMF